MGTNHKKINLTFIVIIAAAFLLQLLVFPFTMVGGDEGRYALDALRIGDGEVPVADYTTRTPILLFLIFWSTQFFGLSLLSLRLPAILFSALTAGFIFLLGKELHSRKAGIISSAVYLLAPIVLWSNQLIKSENLAALLVAVATLFFVKGIKRGRWRWFVFSGILTGVAYIERQSAASFLVMAALVLLWVLWQRKEGIRDFIQYAFLRGLWILLGFLAGFVPIFFYFFLLNKESAAQLWLSLFVVNAALLPQEAVLNLYQFARGWALTFVETIATQGWALYFGMVSFAVLAIKRVFGDGGRKMFAALGFLLLSAPFYIHATNVIVDGNFAPLTFALAALGGSLFWILCVKMSLQKPNIQNDLSFVVISFWIASVFLVYLVYTSGYTREFLVPLSLASGVVLTGLFAVKSKAYKSALAVSLVILWVAGAVWFSDPRTGGWWWRQETVSEAAVFLVEHTQEGEEIFTASALPALLADREVFMRLSPYAFMLAPDKETGWGTQPSPDEILRGLKKAPPAYVVYDGRMERNFIRKTNNEELETFLQTNYSSVAAFGFGSRQDWIEIWEKR